MEEQNRFVSIGDNHIENRRYNGFRRVLINRNINNINDNYISCNISKTKIILLLIITIILSLSNYFYNWNNNISIIKDEPRTILSLFDNSIFKVNSPLNDQSKLAQIRNLKEEINDDINNKTNENGVNNNTVDIFDIKSKLAKLKELDIKKKIFNYLDKYYYKFNWTSIKKHNLSLYKMGDSYNGQGIFSIKKKSLIVDSVRITMKPTEKEFIDNWIIFASDSNLGELILNYDNTSEKESNLFIKGSFSTTVYKGSFFDIVNEAEPNYCQIIYKFKFPFNYAKSNNKTKNKNNYLYLENVDNIGNIFINTNNFSMLLESTCGFNFDIQAEIYDFNEENKIMSSKIIIYCIITGLSGILYSIGIYSIIYNLKQSDNVISAINSDCLLINPIFNTYMSLANINIAIRLSYNFYPLLFLVIFSFFKFIYFDFYLTALYWKKKRNYVNVSTFIKEKLRFYLIYYIITFCSFLWINIVFNYFFIMIICILLWTPSIIFNIKKNNKYGYPLIYIIGTTVDKLIYPIYFRAFKGNFIRCKVNQTIILILVLYVILTIIILYIQIFINPRFMFSKSYQKEVFNFYKTKQELISIKKDIASEECVICLCQIFDNDNDKDNIMIEMQDKSSKNETKSQEDDEEKLDSLDNSTNNLTLSTNKNIEEENEEKDKIINNNNEIDNIKLIESSNNIKSDNNLKRILKTIKIIFTKNFFSFYKKRISALNGELYMLTPCSHVFHAECLEKWFEFKKECPNCRISMEEYLE